MDALPAELVAHILRHLGDGDYGRCRAAASLFRVDAPMVYMARKYRSATPASLLACGSVEGVRYLTRRHDLVFTPRAIHYAAAHGHLSLVRLLQAHVCDGCACHAVERAAARGHVEVVAFLCANRIEGYDGSAMTRALARGQERAALFMWSNLIGLTACPAVSRKSRRAAANMARDVMPALLCPAGAVGCTNVIARLLDWWMERQDESRPRLCTLAAMRVALDQRQYTVVHLLCQQMARIVAHARHSVPLALAHAPHALCAAARTGDPVVFDAVFDALVLARRRALWDVDALLEAIKAAAGSDRGTLIVDRLLALFAQAISTKRTHVDRMHHDDDKDSMDGIKSVNRANNDDNNVDGMRRSKKESRGKKNDALETSDGDNVRASTDPFKRRRSTTWRTKSAPRQHDRGILLGGALVEAVRANQAQTLALLLAAGARHRHALQEAASIGSLEMCKALLDAHPKCTAVVFDAAAAKGHLAVIRYLFPLYGARCTTTAIERAIQSGETETVRYLHMRDCGGPGRVRTDAVDVAASHGHTSTVAFLVESGYFWDEDAVEAAASEGHTRVLQYLWRRRPSAFTSQSVDLAAEGGHADAVRFLLQTARLRATTEGMAAAALAGHLNVVRLLHGAGCPCTQDAMDLAAATGRLSVVEWLHLNRTEGCTRMAVDRAALNDHLDIVCFLWAHRSEGCTPSIAASVPDDVLGNEALLFVRTHFDPRTGRPLRPATTANLDRAGAPGTIDAHTSIVAERDPMDVYERAPTTDSNCATPFRQTAASGGQAPCLPDSEGTVGHRSLKEDGWWPLVIRRVDLKREPLQIPCLDRCPTRRRRDPEYPSAAAIVSKSTIL